MDPSAIVLEYIKGHSGENTENWDSWSHGHVIAVALVKGRWVGPHPCSQLYWGVRTI